MNYLERNITAPADVRATIARELSRYYHELADPQPEVPDFSLVRLLHASACRTPQQGRERELCGAAALSCGQHYDPHRLWVPFGALRTMTTASGPRGGYLTSVETLAPVDVLRPWSVAAEAGVQVITGAANALVMPRVTTATSAGWVAEGGAPAGGAGSPTLGTVSATPHTGIALVKFSLQLLRQGEGVEQFVRSMLLEAAADLIDRAFFNGAGGAEPLGLLSATGVGSQAGASLAHAGTLAMRRQVLAAGGREDRLRFVGTPVVQEVLAGREKAAGSGYIWGDAGILGRPSHATSRAPTGTLIAGDYSTSAVVMFGPGLLLTIDPSQDFNSAGLVARVMLFADIVHPRPEAYSVATSVS